MKKFKGWEVLNEMPEGWKEYKTCGSPLAGAIFITNGKAVVNGQKRALLLVHPQAAEKQEPKQRQYQKPAVTVSEDKEDTYHYPAKEVNTLARKKMINKLLNDIRVDLMVCELENWDKKEYINDLKKIINSFIFKNK